MCVVVEFYIPYLTSGTVIELSAIFVARIIFRSFSPAGFINIPLCCELVIECNMIFTNFVDLFLEEKIY